LKALARQVGKDEDHVAGLIKSNLLKLAPVTNKFRRQFKEKHHDLLELWRFCRLFNPSHLQKKKVEDVLPDLDVIPLVLTQYKPELLRTLVAYIDHCADFRPNSSLAGFWSSKQNFLPSWYECFHYVALFQPSSASVERVFAILDRNFNDQQQSTLEDYKSTSVILR
jgi:hypothetical protein